MITFQEDYLTKYEEKILNKLKKRLKGSSYKVFIGFEYGFFKGMNLYYGNEDVYEKAKDVYNAFMREKLKVRLFTNLPCDYDLIIFLGYSNLLKERIYIVKKLRKIEKALSTL